MATELGKAYVQIMPSAKGISGSIQKAIGPEALSAGKSAGKNIMTAISDSLSKAGSTLTKYITTPALGAATAVAGVVSALGFKRLTGMDNAQAKLKGLGIEGKQLEIVLENARNAVQGTTHTMADAANVAAGALAAGVKEGADLERYIKLVGDAATGANAPMGEMAQIFNRIQGTGKLMGTELEMIEYRLAGFSQALGKQLGVAPEEMRKMVSEGKVSVDDFLAVMEGYAGGMSAAYAETWSGLKDNVLANIGIIGEALLEGLFEDGKKGLAEFLDFLRNSDGLKEWARDTGEKIRQTAQTLYQTIKSMIDWWNGLSDVTKGAFKTLAGITVIAGPVLKVATGLFNTFSKVKGVFTLIVPKILPLLGGFRKLSVVFTAVKGLAALLAGAIGAISTPVLIVTGVIAGLVAGGVALYKNWDKVKEFAGQLWDYLVEGFTFVKDKVVDFFTNSIPNAFSGFLEFMGNVYQTIKDSLVGFFTDTVPTLFTNFIDLVTELPGKVMGFLSQLFITDIPYAVGYGIGFLVDKARDGITSTINFFRDLPGKVKEFVTQTFQNVSQFAINLKDKAIQAGSDFLNRIVEYAKQLPGKIKEFVTNVITSAVNLRNQMRQKAIEAGTNFLNNIVNYVKQLPGRIRDFLSNIINNITQFAKNAKNKAIESGKNIFRGIYDNVKDLPRQMLSVGKDIINGLINGVKNSIGSVVGIAKDIASNFVGGFKKAMGIKSPSRVAAGLMGDVLAGFGVGFDKNENGILDQAKDFIGDLIDVFSEKFSFDFEANFKGIVDQVDEIVTSVVGRPALAASDGYETNSTNVQIVIENMNVRNDQDIHKISRELQRIIDQNKRGRGFR